MDPSQPHLSQDSLCAGDEKNENMVDTDPEDNNNTKVKKPGALIKCVKLRDISDVSDVAASPGSE